MMILGTYLATKDQIMILYWEFFKELGSRLLLSHYHNIIANLCRVFCVREILDGSSHEDSTMALNAKSTMALNAKEQRI